MIIKLYNNLLIMSIVSGGLYLVLRLIHKITSKYFTMHWNYYTYIIIYLFFILPYHKLISLIDLFFRQQNMGYLTFADLSSIIEIPIYNHYDMVNVNQIPLNIWWPYFFMMGSMIFFITIFIQNYKLHDKILKKCTLVDEIEVLEIFAKCKQKMKISKRILIYTSSYISTPFVYGVFKQNIILPKIEFTTEELEYVFYHELVHLKRKDALIKCLVLFINAIHWYNPLAYMSRRNIDQLCEMSCDEMLISKMTQEERVQYCELLLGVLQNIVVQGGKLYSAFSNNKQIERRISKIMDNNIFKKTKWVNSLAVLVTITLFLTGTITAFAASENNNYKLNQNAVVIEEDAVVIEEDSFISQIEEKVNLEDKNARIMEGQSILVGKEGMVITPFANGDLGAGKSYSYNKQYLAKGKKVTINAEWTPTESDIRIGLKSSSGTVTAKTVSDGVGNVTYEIQVSGDYYIYVGNPSSSSVNFDISYIVN